MLFFLSSLNKFHKTPRSYFLPAFSSTPVWLNDKKKKLNKVEEPRLVLANTPHTKDSQRLSSVYKTSAEGFPCTGSTFLLLIFLAPQFVDYVNTQLRVPAPACVFKRRLYMLLMMEDFRKRCPTFQMCVRLWVPN